MLFVVHAIDRKGAMPVRAKFYRAHREHLDEAGKHDVDVVTAGTLIAEDGENSRRLGVRDRRERPRCRRGLHQERSLPRPWRVGDGADPWLQQEAGHADPQPAHRVR